MAIRSVAFLILIALTLRGQNITGTILGTIRDASGAVIAGAQVRVTNEATNIPVKVVTNANGDYVVTNLPAAQYSVLAEMTGFRKACRACDFAAERDAAARRDAGDRRSGAGGYRYGGCSGDCLGDIVGGEHGGFSCGAQFAAG